MSRAKDALQTYQKYYIDRDYEQLDLFQLLKSEFGISSVIYPGSFVHVSPSFVFQTVTYIDSDKNAKLFFQEEQVQALIQHRKQYKEAPSVTFYGADYSKIHSELIDSCDLLISQYAGFISEACKAYLNIDGLLLVNNSHADAGLAALDKDYKLIATVHRDKGKYRISYSALEAYFVPKGKTSITRESLHGLGRGVGYTKTAPLYIFRRVS
ncbi:hypothetical protein C1752_06325 [Acaryochloris thomasi RCC1774]|uniref:Methyltransferase type 11 domain-containing protein n=1 Tax=Acaryochloris thomasi RCC1774 TaxID=1764569 RepID=A0A2W1JBL3_9CYAN|nr:hypothetical protein [Acaryochloris thomasi]PZD71460.1 hypothetical protein C1752_06325 [Acaryochloris thomasi RCC1774]